METWPHTAVMLEQAVQALLTAEDGHYIDATFGRGGHTRALLAKLGRHARVTAFDKDPQAVANAQALAEQDPRFRIQHGSFVGLENMASACAQGILMDLGVSSPQIDNPQRGFSFRQDGPLDMRMDDTSGQTVAQWLHSATQKDIEEVIRNYGEERFAKQIAKAIADRVAAGQGPTRTVELAQLIAGVVRVHDGAKHPATRSFQALRIFINRELDDLALALRESLRVLAPGGRLVVISFHSLEDRIVKQFIAANAKEVVHRHDPSWMLRAHSGPAQTLRLRALGRIKPSAHELACNPRARSAVMRIAQRTSERGAEQ